MKHILFPVHVDPVKPLNPSHVRHLLYADFLYTMRKRFGVPVEYCYNRLAVDVDNQVIKLSEFLKKNADDFQLSDGISVGLAYIDMATRGFIVDDQTLFARRPQLEQSLEGHEYYQYILPEWSRQHQLLGMFNPGLLKPKKFARTVQETLDDLKTLEVIFDARDEDGNVYLDFSNLGLRLRKITSHEEYGYNYLFIALRRLLSVVNPGDVVEFMYDPECASDFLLLAKVVERLGAKAILRPTARVSINGKVASARKGGWQGFALSDILSRFEQQYLPEEIGLGLRLYFLAFNSPKVTMNFEYDALQKCIEKAVAIRSRYGTCELKDLPMVEGRFRNPAAISNMQEWYRTLDPQTNLNSSVHVL